jgi:hypothetical protein
VSPSADVDTTPGETSAPVEQAPRDHDGPERSFIHGELLTPGMRYRSTAQIQDLEVAFTAPSSPLHAVADRRFVGMSTDGSGHETVVALLPIAGLRVFPSPDLEPTDLEPQALADVTDEAPVDIVAWLADRPFLGASRIDEHLRVGNLEGRGFSYEVGQLSDRARACGPAPAARCAPTIWAGGRALHVGAGESGHVLEVDVGGQAVLALVRDEPAAVELVSTLTFDVPPVPATADGATRLPYFTPNLDAGVEYLVDKVGRDLHLLVTSPAEPVAASQHEDVAWFGHPEQPSVLRHYFFTAFDARNVVANADPSLNPYALVGPGGIVSWELDRFLAHTIPLPADPVRWLTEQPYVIVDEGTHDAQVAGHPARVADVRAARLVDGLTCPDGEGNCVMPFAHGPDAFPIVLSSEYVTRVVDVTVGDQHLLIAADLGTPGESVLASLRAFVADWA